MQGPQAHSRILAPAAIMSERAPFCSHHIKHLAGTGGNGQADGGAYRLSFEYFCHLHHIQKRGICTGADTYLVDLDGADLVNGFYGVGEWGQAAAGRSELRSMSTILEYTASSSAYTGV